MKNMLSLLAVVLASAVGAADLENEYVALTFGEKGEIVSLKDKASGRELVEKPMPFAVVKLTDKKTKLEPVRFEAKAEGNNRIIEYSNNRMFVWSFEGGGKLVLSVTPFEGGWTFTLEEMSVKDADEVEYLRVTPVCRKYTGRSSNLLSDDEDGVVVRAYDLKLEMPDPRGKWSTYLPVLASAENGFKGMRCGLAAGPKEKMVEMLRGMTLAAGVPRSDCCGAWCLGAEENLRSYMFAYYEDNFDAWLDALKLSGIGTLHFHHWYSSSGNYLNINRKKFPKGLESLKETVDRVHAAGYGVSLHTLSALIAGPNPWTGPVARDGLQSVFQYTTLNALTNGVTELLVKERPEDDMDTVQTYGSIGNFLRLGGEIVQYSGIRREPPYAFTDIKRGVEHSKAYDHPAGETAHYLRARYYGLYPDADSDVMDEVAEGMAKVYNTSGADRIYFDGAEGIGPRYGRKGNYQIARMLYKMFAALEPERRPVQTGYSCNNKHFWWQCGNTGSADISRYGMKLFDRNHLENAVQRRKSDLLEPQFGWWHPGQWTDETDYFMAHVCGLDGAMSLHGHAIKALNQGQLGAFMQSQLTVLGWYEHFRMAKAYTDAALAVLADFDKESRLRQDANGVWQVETVDCLYARVDGASSRSWTETRPSAGPFEPEIHMLAGAEAYDAATSLPIADGGVADKMKIKTSAKGVTAKVASVADPRRGACFRLSAENATKVVSNAWATAVYTWEKPQDFSPSDGFGFWVKGDGSGALLDVRLQQQGLYGGAPSDGMVRLDFTGWRYFQFLHADRNVYAFVNHVWPFGGRPSTLFATVFTPKNVESLTLTLTEVPTGGKKEVFLDSNADEAMAAHAGAEVLVSGIRAIMSRPLELSNAALVVNGKRHPLPFETLVTGDRVTLEAGAWVLRDEKGELKKKVKVRGEGEEGSGLAFRAGENRLMFTAEATEGAPRADIRLFAPVAKTPALKPSAEWPEKMRWHGMFEAMLPVEYCPKKGATELPNLTMRPGERAEIEVQLVGNVKGPWLEYSTTDGFKRLNLPDGVAGKRVKFTGPVLAGIRALRFGSSDPASADCRVEIIKHYTDKPAADETPPPPVVKEPTKWERLALRVAAEMKEDGFTDAEIDRVKAKLLAE